MRDVVPFFVVGVGCSLFFVGEVRCGVVLVVKECDLAILVVGCGLLEIGGMAWSFRWVEVRCGIFFERCGMTFWWYMGAM